MRVSRDPFALRGEIHFYALQGDRDYATEPVEGWLTVVDYASHDMRYSMADRATVEYATMTPPVIPQD